jgi:hypothetical protein
MNFAARVAYFPAERIRFESVIHVPPNIAFGFECKTAARGVRDGLFPVLALAFSGPDPRNSSSVEEVLQDRCCLFASVLGLAMVGLPISA